MKPSLTVERLNAAGFESVGQWQVEDLAIRHGPKLPARAGVYAFAIDGKVQYVGLASRSLKQRLYFYQKPGASQRTNVRLNELIKAEIGNKRAVEILIAHPADWDWNGLRISGAEGLEGGLIADFDLPWNKRGATRSMPAPASRVRTPRQANVGQRILDHIRKRPGMTELELAKAIYGPSASQPQANSHCRKLVQEGLVERRGTGGVSDPYVYYPRD